MTIQDIVNLSSTYQTQIMYFFLAIPLLAGSTIFFKKKHGSNTGIQVFDSILIYTVSIPGILSLMLMLYSVFILSSNLLELNILLYFLPIVSMIVTYSIIQKSVGLTNVPGFGKISSLLMLIFLTFIVVFLLQKMFIGIIFVGSIWWIIGLFVIIFIGMKIAFDKLVK